MINPLPSGAYTATPPPSGRVGRQSMAANAQADARVQQGLSQESFEPKSAACTAKRLRRDSATNAGYKHRSLPPYLNTLAGDPAKDQA